jgi:hypothetical protein
MSFYCAVNTTTFNSTGHISHSSWVGAGNANWSIEWDFVCTSLAADRYLAGNNSGSATRSVRINTDGTIRVNGVAAITVSPSGTVSAGVRYNVKLESVGTTKSLYIKLATDPSYSTAVCTGTDNFAYTFNTICRASAVYSRFFNIYGASTIGGTYSEVWDGSNAPSTGTTWTGSNGGDLTLNGTQGTADAWWVFYSSGATYQLTALGGTFSYSGAQASLLRNFKLQTLGATYAYSGAPANLTYVPTGTVYTLTALGGSFSYSGGQASLLRRFRLTANGGAYAYSGGSANLTYNQLPGVYRLTALGATYTYAGGIAAMTATGVTPMASPGAYVIQAYVGGVQTISAKIGGRQTINAMVAI